MKAIKKFTLDARTTTPHFPGIGRYVNNLAAALIDRLKDQEKLTLLMRPESELSLLNEDRVDFLHTPASPFSVAVQQRQIPRLLRGQNVYHSPYYLMPYRPGVPTVLTIYDLIPLLFPNQVSLQARLVFRLTTWLALRAAQRIICISAATRKDLLTQFPDLDPTRVRAIPLAPAYHFRPQPETAIKAVRQQYDLPKEFALYLGINKPHKNLARLMQNWPRVSSTIPLVIAGAWDPRYGDLRRAAPDLDSIRFLGRIPEDNLPALYSACRLFIFPSLYEGFGLPVVEALACGASVACSNTSSLPEVGGDAVTYFDPNDPDSMQAGLRTALDTVPDPEKSIRRAGQFTWEAAAEQTLSVYREIA